MQLLTLDIIISDELKFMIENKPMLEHEKLPSERNLAEQFDVQRGTIRKALDILVQEGWIYVEQNKGYFVYPKRITKDVYTLTSTSQSIKLMDKEMLVKIINFKKTEIDKSLTTKLKLPIGTPIYSMARLRIVEGEPVSLELTYVPEVIAPGLSEEEIEKNGLYKTLTKVYGIDLYKSNQTITVEKANQYNAKLLNISEGNIIVKQEGLVKNSSNKSIEYSIDYMKMDRFQYGNVKGEN